MAISRAWLAACVTLTACATPYQAAGIRGGWEDYRADAGTIFVSYKGNGHTGPSTIVRYWRMRAAEVCGGADKYEVVSSRGHTDKAVSMVNLTPVAITRHSAEGYVRCVNGGSYDPSRSLWEES
jgi:hypothetical protein